MKPSNTLAILAASIAFVSPLAAHADNDATWNTRAHAQMNQDGHDTLPAGQTAMGSRMAHDNMTSMPAVLAEIYSGGHY